METSVKKQVQQNNQAKINNYDSIIKSLNDENKKLQENIDKLILENKSDIDNLDNSKKEQIEIKNN